MSPVTVHCTSKLYSSSSTNTNPSSNSSGSFEIRLKERYLLTFQSDEDIITVLEDITSSEYRFMLNIPLVFPTPLSRTLYIQNVVSSFNLDPFVCEFVRAEITDVVGETLGKSKGNEEFKRLLAVQVTKVELIGKEETAQFLKKLTGSETDVKEEIKGKRSCRI